MLEIARRTFGLLESQDGKVLYSPAFKMTGHEES